MNIQPPVLEAATSELPAVEEKVCQSSSPKEGFRAQAQHLQSLVERAEALVDPEARALTRECLQSLLALYGNGLARILSLVQEDSVHGAEILDRLIHDPEISGLLLIHGIHPD
ncbi:MAG TPA: hypothetical protein VHI52_13335, partial [Verrucomicrobiae bacterium]|nr:hypothetical protein [Verrucomicrobiae bacterium]